MFWFWGIISDGIKFGLDDVSNMVYYYGLFDGLNYWKPVGSLIDEPTE